MEKLLLLGSVAAIALAATVVNATKTSVSFLALSNIEAMAQNESTATKKCYFYLGSSTSVGWEYKCNDSTTDTETYDCPSYQSYMLKGDDDKCIDK